MKLLVERFTSDKNATLSAVYLDGVFQCFGLEDEYRENKVAAKTRIPSGTYKVGVRTEGGFHSRYTKRFPEFHQGMLHVQNVPNFEFILIHVGNTHKNTEGCLLVGAWAKAAHDKNKEVQLSVVAYKELYSKVIKSAKKGDLKIKYVDRDRAE